MLISEMHIALDQELDSINVNLEDNLLPEQKDFFFNREIQHFVKTRVRELNITQNQGMDDITKRLIDIETLVEDDVPLVTQIKDDGEFWGSTPQNYYYPVAARCKTSCSNTPLKVSPSYNKAEVSFFRDATDLWDSFEIEANINGQANVSLFDIADYPPYATGVQDVQQDYVIYNLIVDKINSTDDGLSVYWEYYNGEYKPNSFIFITGGQAIDITFKYKTTGNNTTTAFTNVFYDTYNSDNTFSGSDIRLYSLQSVRHFLTSTFNTTLKDSPLGSLNGRLFKAYTLERFIISDVLLTYIRKPRIVDLSLNSNCDLPYAVHDEVVKLAAKSIKAIINSKGYTSAVNETNLIN